MAYKCNMRDASYGKCIVTQLRLKSLPTVVYKCLLPTPNADYVGRRSRPSVCLSLCLFVCLSTA